MGACGYGDDHKEWPIVAYLDPNKANEHVRLANARLKELGWLKNCAPDAMGALDNTGEPMYDEPMYDFWELEILDEIPT